MDLAVLWLNAILWAIVFIASIKRYGFYNAGNLVLAFYFVLMIIAVHLYTVPSLTKSFEGQNLFYLLYLLAFSLLFIRPLQKVSSVSIQQLPSLSRINAVCIVVITFSLLGIGAIYQDFSSGIIKLLTDEDYGASLYHELSQSDGLASSRKGAGNYISVISNVMQTLAPFLFLYSLSDKRISKYVIIGLGLSTFVVFMKNISIGSRVGIVQVLLEMLFFYFFIKRFYSEKVKRYLSPILLAFVLVIGAAFASITLSRSKYSKEDSPIVFVERYASQSVLNFGKYGLEPGGCRYGDKTFPLVKSLFTSNVARSYYDRMNKYKNLKLDESNFILYPGDFIIDFGVIGGTLVLLFFYTFFCTFLKGKHILRFSQIIIVYLLMAFLSGFYQYPFSDYLGNMKLIAFILLALYFHNLENKKIIRVS